MSVLEADFWENEVLTIEQKSEVVFLDWRLARLRLRRGGERYVLQVSFEWETCI